VESESESGGSSEIDLPNEGSSPPNIEHTPDSKNVTSKCEVFEQKVVCILPPIYEYADSRDRNIEESDLEEEEIASHSDAERENERLDNVGDHLNHDLQDELISENAHDNNDLLESLEENIPVNETSDTAITPAATSSTDDDSKHAPGEGYFIIFIK
jgi:hypothetical protein